MGLRGVFQFISDQLVRPGNFNRAREEDSTKQTPSLGDAYRTAVFKLSDLKKGMEPTFPTSYPIMATPAVFKAFENPTVQRGDWVDVEVYVPKGSRQGVKEHAFQDCVVVGFNEAQCPIVATKEGSLYFVDPEKLSPTSKKQELTLAQQEIWELTEKWSYYFGNAAFDGNEMVVLPFPSREKFEVILADNRSVQGWFNGTVYLEGNRTLVEISYWHPDDPKKIWSVLQPLEALLEEYQKKAPYALQSKVLTPSIR